MSITQERKTALIGEYGSKEGDTGSPEVQVALLSRRIAHLTGHFRQHAHDFHSRQGLLKLVSKAIDTNAAVSADSVMIRFIFLSLCSRRGRIGRRVLPSSYPD